MELIIGLCTLAAELYMAFGCGLGRCSRKQAKHELRQNLHVRLLREEAELEKRSMETREALMQAALEELSKQERENNTGEK